MGIIGRNSGLLNSSPAGEHGRNKRDVWWLATESFPDAHFATFPEKLVEPCVLAGCPPMVCVECGSAWERLVEREGVDAADIRNAPTGYKKTQKNERGGRGELVKPGSGITGIGGGHKRQQWLNEHPKVTIGWQPTCECNADTQPGITMDMFMGSGTTAVVAVKLGRRFMGCDLNADYVAMANRRLERGVPVDMFKAAGIPITSDQQEG